MGANTKIEWAHHTFNPWIGCSKVSDGCANCYAEEMMDKRYSRAQWGPGGTRVRTSDANWQKPLQWDKAAAAAGERHRVFCASLGDVFENRQELWPWRDDLFRLILATPHLDWLLLTKRPENAHSMILDALAADDVNTKWPDNIWIGTSIENQEQADKRIPELLRIPARVRFLSMEPLLGPVDLGRAKALPIFRFADKPIRQKCGLTGQTIGISTELSGKWSRHDGNTQPWIDWVIVGGESGHNARPMHPDWARSLRDQCQAAGVPFFFKQWGEFAPGARPISSSGREYTILIDGTYCEFTPAACKTLAAQHGGTWGHLNPTMICRVGKHAAGRQLDGRTWHEVPER